MTEKTDCERRSRVARLPKKGQPRSWGKAVEHRGPRRPGRVRAELLAAEPYVGGLSYIMARKDPLFGLKDNWPALYEALEALQAEQRLAGSAEYWHLAAALLALGQTAPSRDEAERVLVDLETGRLPFDDPANTLEQFRIESQDEGWSGESGRELRALPDGSTARAPRLKAPHPVLRKLHMKD